MWVPGPANPPKVSANGRPSWGCSSKLRGILYTKGWILLGPVWCGCPHLLFPICGRLREDPQEFKASLSNMAKPPHLKIKRDERPFSDPIITKEGSGCGCCPSTVKSGAFHHPWHQDGHRNSRVCIWHPRASLRTTPATATARMQARTGRCSEFFQKSKF